MTPLLFAGLACAGGLGAAARMFVDGAAKSAWGSRFPWGTLLINLTGSFLLGLLTGLTAARLLDGAWQAVLGTGFLGGYTTFSTATVETVRLIESRQLGMALVNALGTLAAGVLLAGLGMLTGTLL